MFEHAARIRALGALVSLTLAALVITACGASGPGGGAPAAAYAPGAAPLAAGPDLTANQPTRLKLQLPARSAAYLPWYIALEQGYFEEQNLAVELVDLPATAGVQASGAGQVDLSGAGSQALPTNANGPPAKIIFVAAADLRGAVAAGESLRAQPVALAGLAIAAVKGVRVMAADAATSRDVLAKYAGGDRDAAARDVETMRPLLANDGILSEAEQYQALAALKAAGAVGEGLEPSQVFDFAPLEEAARLVDGSDWRVRT
jgi:ABC-type nitrate/sulfonate/bicarbonate transport system substrate-binding protein